jgi:hypothetical protein
MTKSPATFGITPATRMAETRHMSGNCMGLAERAVDKLALAAIGLAAAWALSRVVHWIGVEARNR